ncbi:hypothetical protein BCR43DRAFT_495912 [Syncephalastrum racemosum]|uniref:Uncharacterized protein n=1 Tax=Syncephalastrum racemosum TaxID=13706 RepID=A0A1X2H6V1_SYNRA|nr:hypothetical protein BCR43DRAFT_495912 [Syncephalastrum racemosum]
MKRLSSDASLLAMRAKSLRIQTTSPSSMPRNNDNDNKKNEKDDDKKNEDDDNDSLLLTPASSTVAASPTAMSATLPGKSSTSNVPDGYPSPPLHTHTASGPCPLPTSSTPVRPSSTNAKHERSRSVVMDYCVRFPNTWAYAQNARVPIRPNANMDEALVWIQQNNRLVKENERLKAQVLELQQDKAELVKALREMEQKLETNQRQCGVPHAEEEQSFAP